MWLPRGVQSADGPVAPVTEHKFDLDAVAAWLGGDGPIEDVEEVGAGTLRREIRVVRAPAATDVACPPSELESYTRQSGYAGHDLPLIDAAAWLEERIPSPWTRGVVHEAR